MMVGTGMAGTRRVAVLTGGCQCGAVRYALYAEPEKTGICHCRMCQKAVGGPFFAWAAVGVADFVWTRGRPKVFASSSAADRGFCADCGTPLSFAYRQRPGLVDVTIGSLDHPERVSPQLVMGVERRLPWCESVLAALPATETGAGNPPEDLSRIVNRQHPDHDTPAGWQPPPFVA
jgi:hypothetical protein